MINEKENFEKKEIIKLSNDEYLDKVFDLIPSNAIIDKSRCGIGGTTLEFKK